jgi:penicillin-binding protein 2
MIQTDTRPASSSSSKKPARENVAFLNRRMILLALLFGMGMGGFGMQVYRLTVLQGPYYRSESENNFRTEVPVPAPRGKIHDRNGLPLAINEHVFDVAMSPFNLSEDEITSTVARLADLLGQPALRDKARAVIELRPRWESVTLAGELQLDTVLPIAEQGFQLPGVIIQRTYRRVYPAGAVAGMVTGHVGSITSRELRAYEARGYLRNEKVGKLNAELTFEDVLHGTAGKEMVFRDARGKPRSPPQVIQQAQPGRTLVLTLDLRLQRLAHALLEGHKGTIVAIDPRDGAVLAMAQRPDYDPNRPVRGSQYNKIFQAGAYPPGSTFKIVTAAGGLMAGHTPDESVYCDGAFHLGRWRFPCHLRWGHEQETMYDALQHSCNVYFYTWANSIGAERLIGAAEAFGFGRPTDFELAPPGRETAGHLARPGMDEILPGYVLHMAIGQGQLISISPIQLARAYAALCNGGRLMRPRIVQEVRSSIGERVEAAAYNGPVEQGRLPLSDEQRGEILEGLRRAVHRQGGTGSHAGFKEEWRVAGKTGTAETGVRNLPSHAWFCGYAPLEDPEILVLVLVEQAGHGGAVAAPLARQMMAMYFGEPEAEIVPAPPVEAKIADSAN